MAVASPLDSGGIGNDISTRVAVRIDLEKQASGAAAKMPDVTVSLNVWATRHKPKAQPKVRASICLRRAAAEWIESHGPRFKVQIGGKSCNLIRIVPDAERGQFEASTLRGVQRLAIGVVNIWPPPRASRST